MPSRKEKDRQHVGYSEWVPHEYLEQYYSTEEIAEDEEVIYGFIQEFIRKEAPQFEAMLEFGCGPTIHHLIPFVPYIKKVTLADYRVDNLAEIKNWITDKDNAHDWSTYIRGALKIENNTDQESVNKRTQLIKSRIIELVQGDVFQKFPLGTEKTFPLVTSFYCVECATGSKEEWRRLMQNLFSLVAPGGWLIMSALRNAKRYKVKNKYFPSANINENDIEKALETNGFSRDSIDVQAHSIAMWATEGFDSIIISKAMKEPSL